MGSVSVGETKGTRCISAHVKSSESAAAFQTDAVCWCNSYLSVSGYALPVQPGQRPWQHLPGAHRLQRSLSRHFHPYWVLTSTGPATASIQTGRPDPFICLLSFLPWLAMVRNGTCSSLNLILPLFIMSRCWLSISGTSLSVVSGSPTLSHPSQRSRPQLFPRLSRDWVLLQT